MLIVNTAVSTTSCTNVSANLASMECTAVDGQTISVLTKLSTQIASGSVLAFSIGGVRNQRTTAITSSYSFVVTTESGQDAVENKNTDVFLPITQVPELTSMSLIPSSFINSATTTYTF